MGHESLLSVGVVTPTVMEALAVSTTFVGTTASLGGLALAVLSLAAGVKVLNLAEPWRVRAIMFAAVGALAGAFPAVLVLFSRDFDPEDLVHLIATIGGTSVLIANVFVILQLSRSRHAFV